MTDNAEHVAIVSPDGRRRFSIGKYLARADRYRVYTTPTGGVTLEPILPDREEQP